jgi:hypothetical protein
MFLSWRVMDFKGAKRDRNLAADPALEIRQFVQLEFLGLRVSDSLVGVVRKLLGLEARTRVELYLETLPGLWRAPLSIDPLVLVA